MRRAASVERIRRRLVRRLIRAHRDASAIELPRAVATLTLALQIVERAAPETQSDSLPDFSI